MAGLVEQAIISSIQMPGMEQSMKAIGILAATAAAGFGIRWRYDGTEERAAAHSPSPAGLRNITTQSPEQIRKTRLRPVYKLLAGVGLVAACVAAHPTIETAETNVNANAVVVEDVSSSMLYTRDLGDAQVTRMTAVSQALQAAEYNGRLGIIHTAKDSEIVVPLTKGWRQHTNQIANPGLGNTEDPTRYNGGKIAPAITQAASELPLTSNAKREGTVVVFTDGTVDDTAEALSSQAAKLEKTGVKVKIVITGTANGTYKRSPTSPVALSPAKPDRFSGFGSDNVRQAETVSAVKAAVQQELKDASTDRHKKYFYPPIIASLALFGWGLASVTRKISGRYV